MRLPLYFLPMGLYNWRIAAVGNAPMRSGYMESQYANK